MDQTQGDDDELGQEQELQQPRRGLGINDSLYESMMESTERESEGVSAGGQKVMFASSNSAATDSAKKKPSKSIFAAVAVGLGTGPKVPKAKDKKLPRAQDGGELQNDEVVVLSSLNASNCQIPEDSAEDRSSGKKSNYTTLSHRRMIDSRKASLHDQSISRKQPHTMASQDNVAGWVPSEVSLSESEFKSSIRQNFLSQKQRNQVLIRQGDHYNITIGNWVEITQATVMQQRMEMMPKKHRHMIMKKTQH